MAIVATDIGGTFTDIVGIDDSGSLTVGKVLSTPGNYADGLIGGVSQVLDAAGWSAAEVSKVLHGCTVATNAVLEKKGARTVLVTTDGFRDVLELRRIRVPKLYDPLYRRPDPLVPRQLRLEVRERMAADGGVVVALVPADIDELIARINALEPQAIAVCLINAHANPAHEQVIGERLRAAFPEVFLSLSSEILPELREYERTSTTVVNAYVGPPVQRYLTAVETRLRQAKFEAPLVLMQSSGGMVESQRIRHVPAALLECGPAAGVIGAAKMGAAAGYPDLLSFDMGGTTAKAALIKNGQAAFTDVFEVGGDVSSGSTLAGGGGYAVKLPAIDMAEVGAGGGSLVTVDAAGAIRVGPESAGSSPGPACYGFGNERPTVTDANVVLGYIDPGAIAGGGVRLDRNLAVEAIRRYVAEPLGLSVEDAAFGVRRIANASMVRALKTVSVYRGHDTRLFRLFAFGGNGGLHGPEIASELGIREVIVPPAAGVFSAVGLLLADLQSTRTLSCPFKLAEFDATRVENVFARLERLVADDLAARVDILTFTEQVLCRYSGQAFELPVSMPDGWHESGHNSAGAVAARLEVDFAAAHRVRYGYNPPPGTPVEIVSLRATGREPAQPVSRIKLARAAAQSSAPRQCYFGPALGVLTTDVITRESLRDAQRAGPLIIGELDGTTLVPPGATARLDDFDNVVIALSPEHSK
jgi:N-methylhydantoinase A